MRFLLLLFAFCPFGLFAQVQPLVQAHAHNDYEHPKPLLDALQHGFTSVEADIHLIDGELYVAHERPLLKKKDKTLRNLYLRPLQSCIQAQNGQVYPGFEGFFYLMIDVKSNADSTLKVLKSQLDEFRDMICLNRNSVEETNKPVKIFLSGNRPSLETLLQDSVQLIALDGRPGDLGKGISVALMPVVSIPYDAVLKWHGRGKPSSNELKQFRNLVQQTHADGRKFRLWGIPDKPAVWAFLLDEGVDLINTDRLADLQTFLMKRQATIRH